MIARLRRRLMNQEEGHFGMPSPLQTTPDAAEEATVPSEAASPRHDDNSLLAYDLKLLRKDIVRTGVLAVLAFLVEILLYIKFE